VNDEYYEFARKTDALLETHACTMPRHGREDAPSACCRPGSPQFAGLIPTAKPGRASWLQFWSDHQVWQVASRNTLNCLIGCRIGDVSMIV
jgi:hypothetical protein